LGLSDEAAKKSSVYLRQLDLANCLLFDPRVGGAILLTEWKEVLSGQFVMAAQRRRTPLEQQYCDCKL